MDACSKMAAADRDPESDFSIIEWEPEALMFA